MTFLNSIQSYISNVSLRERKMTFFEQITLIKIEIESSPMNVLELRRQLNDLKQYLQKASPEERREVFKVLNQVKDKTQTSGNDWEKHFKDLERKFIQTDLMSWGNMFEIKKKISEISERILRVFDNNLTEFTMTGLELNSLPEAFMQLSTLHRLYIAGDGLESLPKSISHLSQLQLLDLIGNRLESLPESFGQLSQLQQLYLSDNCFKSTPESLGQLSQLQILDLSDNRLIFLSKSLGRLTQIQKLHLSNNQLRSLPEFFGQLSQIRELYLFNNRLESLPESFEQLSQLQILHLSKNQFTSLPESFWFFSQLQTLGLSDNQLESLPMSLAHCRRIAYLYLNSNANLKKLPPFFEFLYSMNLIYIEKTSIDPEEVTALRVKWKAVNGVDAIQLLPYR